MFNVCINKPPTLPPYPYIPKTARRMADFRVYKRREALLNIAPFAQEKITDVYGDLWESILILSMISASGFIRELLPIADIICANT